MPTDRRVAERRHQLRLLNVFVSRDPAEGAPQVEQLADMELLVETLDAQEEEGGLLARGQPLEGRAVEDLSQRLPSADRGPARTGAIRRAGHHVGDEGCGDLLQRAAAKSESGHDTPGRPGLPRDTC